MRAAGYRRIALIASSIAVTAHATALALPMLPNQRGLEVVTTVPIMLAIETLTLLGIGTYLRSILRRTRLKKQTQVGVFTGSLALALTIPALFVPAWTRSGTEHLLAHPMPGFWVWAASLTGIGVAIHLVTIARWRGAAYP